MPRLPMQASPYSLGSSARKSITSIVCCGRMPASRSARTISSPVASPAIPSNRPPDGTLSLCDPIAITPSAGFEPSSRPIRLPALSIRVASPASANRLASQARPSRNNAVNERRVHGRAGSVISASAMMSAHSLSASSERFVFVIWPRHSRLPHRGMGDPEAHLKRERAEATLDCRFSKRAFNR
jgi:hypothetical protein